MHNAHCVMHNAHCVMHNTQCQMNINKQNTLLTAHYKLHTAHYTLTTAHCTWRSQVHDSPQLYSPASTPAMQWCSANNYTGQYITVQCRVVQCSAVQYSALHSSPGYPTCSSSSLSSTWGCEKPNSSPTLGEKKGGRETKLWLCNPCAVQLLSYLGFEADPSGWWEMQCLPTWSHEIIFVLFVQWNII